MVNSTIMYETSCTLKYAQGNHSYLSNNQRLVKRSNTPAIQSITVQVGDKLLTGLDSTVQFSFHSFRSVAKVSVN